jgi:hypothetical protein
LPPPHFIPEDGTLHNYPCENVSSCKKMIVIRLKIAAADMDNAYIYRPLSDYGKIKVA